MLVSEVVNMVSDELRDSKATKYARTSIVSKLKEAMTQFASESKILKHSVEISPVVDQREYNLPRFGIPFLDITGEWSDFTTTSLVVPTYLSLIRLGWKTKIDSGATSSNTLLRPNSTFERDEVGTTFNEAGIPLYHYNDELSFYNFGLWPMPDASAIDVGTSGDPQADYRIQVDYVRDVMYYSDAAATTAISRSDALETSYLDPEIPEEFLSKIYLLVCFLRLKNSIDPIDVNKAANYKALYEQELLNKALESGSHMDRYNQFKVKD